ncbi:hypothetical protein A2U01_0032254, partial [Trifolium medium]|nr:hypothetical protein [Trifolium medium]
MKFKGEEEASIREMRFRNKVCFWVFKPASAPSLSCPRRAQLAEAHLFFSRDRVGLRLARAGLYWQEALHFLFPLLRPAQAVSRRAQS